MKPTSSSNLTVEQVQQMVRRELSTPARLRYLLLLLITLTAAGLVTLLWLTEPDPLPLRTHISFALLTLINLAWSALFGWLVTRRKALFAMHRVIAGWMALAFCALFLLVGSVIAIVRTNTTAFAFVGLVGTCQLFVALVILNRAHHRRRELLARRKEISDQLSRY